MAVLVSESDRAGGPFIPVNCSAISGCASDIHLCQADFESFSS